MCRWCVFYPLLQHTNTQDNDDENVTTRDNQRQQRIGAKQPHIQLTEKQLDKLLKLNDLYNAGVIGHTSEKDMNFLRQFDDKEIAKYIPAICKPFTSKGTKPVSTWSFVIRGRIRESVFST